MSRSYPSARTVPDPTSTASHRSRCRAKTRLSAGVLTLPLRPSAPTAEPSRVVTKFERTQRRPAREGVEVGELGCRDAGARVRRSAWVEEDAHGSECVSARRPTVAARRTAPRRRGAGLQGCARWARVRRRSRQEARRRAARRQPRSPRTGAPAPRGHARRQALGQGGQEGREEAQEGREGARGQGGRAGHVVRGAARRPRLRARRPRPALARPASPATRRTARRSWPSCRRGSATCRSGSTPSPRAAATRSVLLVIQGMDTSGKGGIMRHVVGAVDPQGVAHHLVQGAERRGEGAPVPLAHPHGPCRRRVTSASSTAATTRTCSSCGCTTSCRGRRGRAATPRSTPSSRGSSTAARRSSR